MYVSQYTTYIQPKSIQNKTIATTSKTEEKSSPFERTLQELTKTPDRLQQNPPPLRLDGRASKNFYANRYKLLGDDFLPKQVKNFQDLSAKTQLVQSYSASFTTFYDLTSPKKALLQTPTYKNDTLYDQQRKQTSKKRMVTTYIANDTYYKKAYAS